MNYYEEFGLSQNASAEEIKEAYRALMRLLHPDHQSDKNLQQVAESQVKKLNQIYKILSDPERRRQYDRDLSEGPERMKPIIIHAPPPPQRSFWNTGSVAWISAVVAFAGLLVWMASRPSPGAPAYSHESGPGAEAPRSDTTARAIEPGEPIPQPSLSRRQPTAATPPVASASAPPAPAQPTRASIDADALRLRLVQAMNERDAAQAELARVQSRAEKERLSAKLAASSQRVVELKKVTPAAPTQAELKQEAKAETRNEPKSEARTESRPPAVAPPQPVLMAKAMPPPPDIPMRNTISGSWVYRKPILPPKSKGMYPPEFIETVITEENGQVRGTYHARYRAPDKPIYPEVSFQFAGKINGDSGIFPWNGAGGSKGEVTLKLTPEHSLRVDWTASQLGSLGFYRGTAVLVKKD